MRQHLQDRVARVVIADGHPGVRHALEALVTISGAGSVAGVAADLRAAGPLLRGADVLVVNADLLADDRGGLGPLPATTTIVAVGMERHPAATERALRHGAAAYLVMDELLTELDDVLRRAVRPTGDPSRSEPGRRGSAP